MMEDTPFIRHQGRLVSTDSAEGKELLKWEKPYVYQRYPKMMYRAQPLPGGKMAVGSHDEAFSRSCQLTVNSEAEHKAALESGEGWRNTPQEALEFHQKLHDQIARAAAERAYADRNMSERAQAEAAQFEADNSGHQAEIPEARRRKRD